MQMQNVIIVSFTETENIVQKNEDGGKWTIYISFILEETYLEICKLKHS